MKYLTVLRRDDFSLSSFRFQFVFVLSRFGVSIEPNRTENFIFSRVKKKEKSRLTEHLNGVCSEVCWVRHIFAVYSIALFFHGGLFDQKILFSRHSIVDRQLRCYPLCSVRWFQCFVFSMQSQPNVLISEIVFCISQRKNVQKVQRICICLPAISRIHRFSSIQTTWDCRILFRWIERTNC